VGSDDASLSLNDFRLRISPTNPAQVKANKAYHDKHLQSISTDYEVALNEALVNRYEMIIDYHHLSQIQQLIKAEISIRNEVMKQLPTSGIQNFDTNDLINLQSDQTDLLIKENEAELELEAMGFYMRLDMPQHTDLSWSPDLIADIAQVAAVIEAQLEAEERNNIHVQEAAEELALKEQLFNIEKAESRSKIGYIQGNYDFEKGNELNEHLGFQVGLRIPIVNTDKPKLNRERVDLIEEKKEYEATKSVINRQNQLLDMSLRHLLDRYRLLTDRISQAQSISPSENNLNGLLTGLKLAKYQHSLMERKIDLEKKILEQYIKYLDVKGALIQRPLINHLSSVQAEIPTY
jgi:hypothetical protein